ncbi:MAG: hypothetical protein ABIZ52_00755 [Candidatus Limnocylindrales bacterium]
MSVHASAERPMVRGSAGGRLPHTARSGTGATTILELQRTAGNRAVTGALRAAGHVAQRAPDDKKKPKRVTGYLGLNPGASKEVKALKKTSRQQILASLNDGDAEKRFAGNPGIGDFIFGELGYSVADVNGWATASTVLLQATPALRDQLADVMRWMHRAEKGEIVIERLVLSGHSNGVKLWGDQASGTNGAPGKMLIEQDLGNLARAFPKAAAGVEDIMFSACFSLNAVEIVKKTFPNLQSVWSYGGWSPEIDQGSQEHMQEWSKATEGSRTPNKSSARGSTALWTRDKGYLVGDPNAAAAGPLFSECQTLWENIGEPMFVGAKDFAEPELRPLYYKLNALSRNVHADGMAKGFAAMTVGKVLRLRFWVKKIRERFGSEHGPKLQPAYDALQVPPPNWTRLTRVGMKAHMDLVDRALESNKDPAVSELIDKYLRNGLWLLGEDIIDETWI